MWSTEHRGFAIRRLLCTLFSVWASPTRQMVWVPHFYDKTSYLRSRLAAYMEFIFERLKHRNADGSLQIMYTIHGKSQVANRPTFLIPAAVIKVKKTCKRLNWRTLTVIKDPNLSGIKYVKNQINQIIIDFGFTIELEMALRTISSSWAIGLFITVGAHPIPWKDIYGEL